VPAPMIAYWEKEMMQQTQTLRADAKASAIPKKKRRPKKPGP
jgi:hypothetical protein